MNFKQGQEAEIHRREAGSRPGRTVRAPSWGLRGRRPDGGGSGCSGGSRVWDSKTARCPDRAPRHRGLCWGGFAGSTWKGSLKSPRPEPPALLPTVLGAAGDQDHLPTPRHSLELRKVFQSCFGRGSH